MKSWFDHELEFIGNRKKFDIEKYKNNFNNSPSNERLPKLKWDIKEQTNQEIQYIKNHTQAKKKKLNQISFANMKLMKIYHQLKVKEAIAQRNINEQDHERAAKKDRTIEDLETKRQEAIEDFCKSLIQKDRLNIILRLCEENKTKNDEYLQALNYLLLNFKKMINAERDIMKKIGQELGEIRAANVYRKQMEEERQRNELIMEREAGVYMD